jgi:hypothetical protein
VITKRKRRTALAAALAAATVLTASCASQPSGFPEVEGWTQTGEVRIYTADNLWEYIDGAAVLFVEYGVRTCMTADLSAADVSATIDLYDMGSPLAAVGVFLREAAGRGTDLAGTTIAYQALMVKGSTYAKVNVFEGELTESTGRQLLRGLAASLPGEAVMPQEFSLLPEAGKVAGSEGYQPRSFLGLTELTDCVYGDYVGSDGATWQGFVVLPTAAAGVWETLADPWQSFELDGQTVRFREVPYSGLVGLVQTDTGLFGASGAADEAQLLERLAVIASLR